MITDFTTAQKICLGAGRERLTTHDDVALPEASSGTLAAPVYAPADLPGFASSAMDGWIVSGDGPWRLADAIRTGDSPPTVPLAVGWARPICTGAPLPPGDGAILRTEHGASHDGVLTAIPGRSTQVRGKDIRPRAEEARAGDVLLPAGVRMTPAAAALAAASGVDTVTLRDKPIVRLVLVGSEIVSTGVPPAGRVRDAYGVPLPSLLEGYGATRPEVIRIPDDRDAAVAALSDPLPQLFISTGGSGRGMTDVVRTALEAIGAELLLDEVAMRPGHPVMLAARPDGALILCLPGNPLAAMTTLITLGLLVIDGMLGRPAPAPRYVLAGEDLDNPSDTSVRVVAYCLRDERAHPAPHQGTGMLRGLVIADGLAVVPPAGAREGEALLSVALPWR